MSPMGSNNMTRAVPALLILVLILLSSGGAEADNCGVLISDATMCRAPIADACETWCYHKGYSTGACYAGANGQACICENPCHNSKEAQAQKAPSSVKPARP